MHATHLCTKEGRRLERISLPFRDHGMTTVRRLAIAAAVIITVISILSSSSLFLFFSMMMIAIIMMSSRSTQTLTHISLHGVSLVRKK